MDFNSFLLHFFFIGGTFGAGLAAGIVFKDKLLALGYKLKLFRNK